MVAIAAFRILLFSIRQATTNVNSREQIPTSVFHDLCLFVSFFTRSNAHRRESVVFFLTMPWEDVIERETFIASYQRSEIRWRKEWKLLPMAHDSWNNYWERWAAFYFLRACTKSILCRYLHVYWTYGAILTTDVKLQILKNYSCFTVEKWILNHKMWRIEI